MGHYYEPSGQFSRAAFIFFILSSVIVLPILAFFYASISLFLKGESLNIIATLLFAFAVGIAMQFFVIKLGKIRNKKLAGIMGILFGLIATYLYLYYLAVLISKPDDYLILALSLSDLQYLQPHKLFSLINEANNPVTTINGGYLILKAIVIIFISRQAPRTASQRPFSEIHQVWLKEKKIHTSPIENTNEFVSELEKGETEILDKLKKNENKSESHAVLRLYYSDFGEFYLKARNKIAKMGKDNKIRFKKDRFLKNYISIDASSGQRLLSLSE